MKSPFFDRLKEKVIVFDGAMGTSIQAYNLSADDFDGLDGCNEYLCITRPDIVKEIHSSFFEVGCDIVETNSFGSSQIVLAEYNIGQMAYEVSKKSAEIAREVANSFSTPSWPRFVSGSVGPTTKLLTLRHATFDAMYEAYLPNMQGLIEGGVDLIQIETCQDVLQLKCAVIAARAAMRKLGREIPICVQITIETNGTMLIGTEVQTALVVGETMPIDIFGMNCATGPDLMSENVRYLGTTSSRPISILPNAGLPRNENGKVVYDLTPESLADYHEIFVKDYGINLVGGCCGTTPAHLKEVYDRVGGLAPLRRPHDFSSHVSSIYSSVALDQDVGPLIVGERCNANGSKVFKELLLKEAWDEIVEMGREEVAEGAHVLDICTAFVGRNEAKDMTEVLSRFATQVTAPIMIDTTQLDVMEAACKLLGGRSMINSINLEDGEEKFDKICKIAVEYGAALIALTIDEAGMAKTASEKLRIALRMHDLCTERHKIPADALIYDSLTFTIASGDEDSRKAGIETLEGIRLIKKHVPKARTILGVSNISFGLKPSARQILNSVFLAEARKAGLDSCIINSKKIIPTHTIPEDILKVVLDLIYDRRTPDYDPLFVFIEKTQGSKEKKTGLDKEETGSLEEILQNRIINGKKIGIEPYLTEALKKYTPVQIINTILLKGMKTVGELFGSGQMQLPFVLQSAETMKLSVSYLEPFMEKIEGVQKGTMVIATVKGDVHDIGKNLVDIILTNNGYKVINLGIKQPLDSILAAVDKYKPDVVGMSGLLVKSTVVMKENLEEMTKKGFSVPVICGGAALNRAYVEVDLTESYKTGSVYYGADAFSGLQIMDELTGQVTEKKLTGVREARGERKGETRDERNKRLEDKYAEYAPSSITHLQKIPEPPFWGAKHVFSNEINMAELFPYINKKALYANQWMYRRGKKSSVEYREFLKTYVEPRFNSWCEKALNNKWLEPKVAYGYFPCQSDKNDLIIYDNEKKNERCRISFPRQVADKRRCIADFFLPKSSGQFDVIAFHVVTIGHKASEVCKAMFERDEYTDYLHFYGLSVESAEALAEFWHRKIRQELGIAGQDGATIDLLFRQTYRGARYSFGYPACPNLEDQKHIFKLLEPEKLGVSLTSEFQLVPEQSTSALVVHHPDAYYYSV
ncbi:MAG: methionine synthase [bacterium]|nr:methionine synthase [bacterium]